MGGYPDDLYVADATGKEMYADIEKLFGAKKPPLQPMSEQEREALRPVIYTVQQYCTRQSLARMEGLVINFYN